MVLHCTPGKEAKVPISSTLLKGSISVWPVPSRLTDAAVLVVAGLGWASGSQSCVASWPAVVASQSVKRKLGRSSVAHGR